MDNPLAEELFKSAACFRRLHTGFLNDGTLSRGEFFLLKAVYQLSHPPDRDNPQKVHVSHLREHVEVSMPAVSQLLGALERKRLITRNVSAQDRRRIAVTLTPEGEIKVKKTMESFQAGFCEIIDRLGEEDTRTFIRLCARIREILDELCIERFFE